MGWNHQYVCFPIGNSQTSRLMTSEIFPALLSSQEGIWRFWGCGIEQKRGRETTWWSWCILRILPIGCMGLVYLPTFTIQIRPHVGKYSIHRSYGLGSCGFLKRWFLISNPEYPCDWHIDYIHNLVLLCENFPWKIWYRSSINAFRDLLKHHRFGTKTQLLW